MVIDGHSLAFRAFYGAPVESFRTREGQHTNAVHGFISMLLVLLEKYQPESLAVAFDISRHSFRTEQYPEYKGTRGATPPEFKGQVPLLKEALQAMGIVTLEKEGYEADDILATLATSGAALGKHVFVVSGDRDTIQLVTEDVTLLYPSTQGIRALKEYTPEEVILKYSVKPEQYPDIAALVGETSDNLPGVPKVGPKTAAKWINQYGSLEGIFAHKDEIGGKVGESLRENIHLVERNRRLNRLVTDVDLPLQLQDLTRGQIDMDRVREVFTKLEFRSMLVRVARFAGASLETVSVPAADAALQEPAGLPAFNDPQHLNNEELEQWLLKSETPAVYIAADLLDGRFNVGLATLDSSVEFEWLPGGADYAEFESWLESEQPKCFWQAKETMHLLSKIDKKPGGVSDDAQLALALLRPDLNEKDFRSACQEFLNFEIVESDPKQLFADSTSITGSAQRAWLIKHLLNYAKSSLDERGLQLYSELEMPLIEVLYKLESRGVTIDMPVLEAQLADLKARVLQLQAEAFRIIDAEVNLSSPKQLQKVLFEDLKLPATRKIKSGYSTDASALRELYKSTAHPFLAALLEHRETIKLAQMVQTLLESVAADGKIHTTLQQVGAATGRLASNAPNLQNIPVRRSEGERIRGSFTSDPEYDFLLTADYSQIEMRVMAHLSEDQGLISAFNEGEDLHRSVGAKVFGVAPEDVTAAMRAKVKAMSYGLAYGLGAFGLAKQLDIGQAEAKQLMADYFLRFGGVRDYLRNVVDNARERGYTSTIMGRRRPFPELKSANRVVRQNAERAALNAPIQGSSADIIKLAMLKIEQRISASSLKSRMILQIHDELMFEVVESEREQLEQIVREEMTSAAKLSVPLEVSLGFGPNWQLAAH